MKRKAFAIWKGALKNGKGEISTDSGVLSATPYSFSTRFENEVAQQCLYLCHIEIYSKSFLHEHDFSAPGSQQAPPPGRGFI